MEERLQKYLASCGIGSRRTCEDYIVRDFVKVNGVIVNELGYKVKDGDIVEYKGKVVKKEKEMVYIMLNKPLGYVTTVSDEKDRKTVMDLVQVSERIVPIGRLDMFTSGLLLLTNDGDLVYELTHPKHNVTKTYEVAVDGELSEEELKILRDPMDIDGYVTKGATVKLIEDPDDYRVKLHITISEGRNRQVRKMIETINHRVLYLKRIAIGKLEMNKLRLGDWEYLDKKDLQKIYK